MSNLNKFTKLANLLDQNGFYDEANLVDNMLKKADLQLEMEKQVEKSDKTEDDKEDKKDNEDEEGGEKKTKKITLSFD